MFENRDLLKVCAQHSFYCRNMLSVREMSIGLPEVTICKVVFGVHEKKYVIKFKKCYTNYSVNISVKVHLMHPQLQSFCDVTSCIIASVAQIRLRDATMQAKKNSMISF